VCPSYGDNFTILISGRHFVACNAFYFSEHDLIYNSYFQDLVKLGMN
jgi:hypothetical protein